LAVSEGSVQRRLAAILAADVVNYSRLMHADEAGTLAALKARRCDLLEPLIARHGGRLFKLLGDGALVEFGSAVDAVQCAVALQDAFAGANAETPDERRIVLRIGLHLGDVMVDGSDLYGDGVNIAARLEGLADPGGVLLSEDVHRQVGNKLNLGFDDIGPQHLRNIAQPVRAYRVKRDSARVNPRLVSTDATHLSDKPSIAVLPLTNMSGDPDQEYFSDGITEDIITELSRFHEFSVIARNSSFRYKGLSPRIEDVGRELGVKYVVEGSVRKTGNRVRVTVQLIEAASAAHIWAERYDRSVEDIFAIQDEVTEAVVARIAEGIKGARTLHARSRPLHSASAYELVLQARPYRTAGTIEASATAAKLLRQAIEIDPKFALAHASLAFVRAGDYEEGWVSDPDATLAEALAAAKQAVALDHSDGYAHASLAYVLLKFREYDQAEREIDLALSLNPNHVNIIMTSAWTSVVSGDPERAIARIMRARRLNPLMGGWELWTLGEAYLDAKRYEEALDSFAKVTDPPAFLFLERAICLAYLGQSEDARRSLRMYLDRARREMPGFPGEDPAAWRAIFLRFMHRRRPELTEHFIEGARKAGLNVAQDRQRPD
jgi:TolB-like protein/class 3 adenylate cyclase